MRRLLKPYSAFLLLGLVLLALLAGLGHTTRIFERVRFDLGQWLSPNPHTIGLNDYRAVIQAQVIEGLDDDISALTFDPDRETLFTVTNKRSELIELSLEGKILRRIPLTGFGDPEAVEYISEGVYVISDEHEHRLIKVRIDDDTQHLNARDAQQLSIGVGLSGNKGFEGLAYDSSGQRLFVAKERNPMLIYEIQGFPYQADGPTAVHVVEHPERDARLFVSDLSSLQFDEGSGHLFALSDESKLILELDDEGKPIASLSLSKNSAGLARTIPQPEGIALDADGKLYLVSEPNLFYVFEKP